VIRVFLRDAWVGLGRPPWYTWPLLVVPLILSSIFLTYAAVCLVAGAVLLALGELVWGFVVLAFVPVCVIWAWREE
jgi:hypothetical protein